jgi:hypothetical protein
MGAMGREPLNKGFPTYRETESRQLTAPLADHWVVVTGNLKRELPRISFALDFRAFQRAGQRLIELHLKYEKAEPFPLSIEETAGKPLSYRVDDKMRLSKDWGD